MTPTTCVCGAPLPEGSTRRRIYCSTRCRVAALRGRRAVRAALSELENLEPAGAPRPAAFPPASSPPAPGPAPAHPDDQVSAAALEAIRLAAAFDRLQASARPQLAWRCAGMAGALHAALADYFGELLS